MLTEAEKVDARRYLGYPAYGAGAAGFDGWRFYQISGEMEYRLNNLASPEEAVLRSYLGTLSTLEQAISDAGAGLDTASAMGWVRNPAELVERERLFDSWRRRLCAFVGVPPGPAFASGAGVALIV